MYIEIQGLCSNTFHVILCGIWPTELDKKLSIRKSKNKSSLGLLDVFNSLH